MFLLGDALRELGRWDDAEKSLLAALSFEPQQQRACVMASLGELNDSRGAFDKAEEWFRRATEDAIGAEKGWIWINGMISRRGMQSAPQRAKSGSTAEIPSCARNNLNAPPCALNAPRSYLIRHQKRI